jgi:hypothetical protein
MRHSFFFRVMGQLRPRKQHLRTSLLFTSEKTSMLTKGSALNVGKGWAVASLFRKARENRQMKFYLKTAGAFLIALMVTNPSFASGTDLLLITEHQRLIPPSVLAPH